MMIQKKKQERMYTYVLKCFKTCEIIAYKSAKEFVDNKEDWIEIFLEFLKLNTSMHITFPQCSAQHKLNKISTSNRYLYSQVKQLNWIVVGTSTTI